MSGNVFRQGFLQGQSRTFESVDQAASGKYDLAVFVSSWDSRCIAVTRATDLRATVGALMLFDFKDNIGLREAHDQILTQYVRRVADRAVPVVGDSIDLDPMWQKLYGIVHELLSRLERPLRVFIDLSACPRFYALSLATLCLKMGAARTISVFYAEGEYPQQSEDAEEYEVFTSGGWTAVNIPGLQGEWNPAKRLLYLVSVGFEGGKTLRFVSRSEPDRVSLLFPNPGVRPDYATRTMAQNQQMVDLFKVPPDQIIEAPAGDAIAAWRALCEVNVERGNRENVNYVCCGTKPHSLALALRAIVLGYPAVLYIVPDQHKVVRIEPSGVYWNYEIGDVTAFDGRGVT